MIDQLISELVAYGLQNGLIEDADKVYVTNGLLELFQKQDYQEPNASVEPRDLHFILEDMLAIQKICEKFIKKDHFIFVKWS